MKISENCFMKMIIMITINVFANGQSTSAMGDSSIESISYSSVRYTDSVDDTNDDVGQGAVNGLAPKRYNTLCINEFIFCASSFSCLDVVCVDKLIEEIDSCRYETIYCPETDECLVNCPPSIIDKDMTTITAIGTSNLFPFNSTDVIDNATEDESFKNVNVSVLIVPMVLNFRTNYSTTVGNRSSQFIQTIRDQLTKISNISLPESSIQNLVILKEPFKVSFDLVYWPEEDDFKNITVSLFRETVAKLEEILKTSGIAFTGLNGETIVAVNEEGQSVDDQDNQKQDTPSLESTPSPSSPPPSPPTSPSPPQSPPASTSSPEIPDNLESTDDGSNNLMLILGLIIGALLLILIVLIGVIYGQRVIKRRQVVPKVVTFSRVARDVRQDLVSSAHPININLSRVSTGNREDILSRHDDDGSPSSWLASRKRENGSIIPDPAVYVPPAKEELQRTPKLPKSIVLDQKTFKAF